MLKALELIGFKSFADKTRFEFPRGITCVVGPNGSGKSNVVDAIKWVLGEQSVKSLRGKEMADVIFNGSGSRTPLNAAEATLTFDNAQRLLAIDSPEVHITRRVYRSGEGEYLINRQPCRLRDIRELFSGTGMATEAYSVIEQGKVDVLLQSSPRDRRLIFEEAAGISRFKAKKIESLRRLERVEQNLLRLSDIVAEVEGRLKSVRAQAAKARRYKEHVDRLQELRTQVGLADWRSLSQQLAVLDGEIASLAEQRQTLAGQSELVEAQVLDVDRGLVEAQDALRQGEARNAEIREQIATLETTTAHQRTRLRDFEEEMSRHRGQLAAMSLRAGDLRRQLTETSEALCVAEAQHSDVAQRLAVDEGQLADLTSQLGRLAADSERDRKTHVDAVRAAAALTNEIAAFKSQIAARQAARDRARRQLEEVEASRETLGLEVAQLRSEDQSLVEAVQQRQVELAESRRGIARLRERQATQTADLNRLRERHAGATERATVLEELESRLEGLHAGVKEVLLHARHEPDGPFRTVRGLVADLFRASVDMAPLVDVTLGERAQYLVVNPGSEATPHAELLAHLERESGRFKGRVGFLLLRAEGHAERVTKDTTLDRIDLSSHEGVVGRMDRLVEAPPDLQNLAQRLLGQVWIVETIAHARGLADGVGRGLSFVTQAGEMLSADGTLSVGPRQSSFGLVSRRSELRSLREVISDFAAAIAAAKSALATLDRELTAADELAATLAQQQLDAQSALQQHRVALQAGEAQSLQLEDRARQLRAELTQTEDRQHDEVVAMARAEQRLAEAEMLGVDAEGRLSAAVKQQTDLALARQECQLRVTESKVERAKSEERIGSLRARLAQCERDQQDRDRALDDGRSQLALCDRRSRASELSILQAESQIAELYLVKERLAVETVQLVMAREGELDRKTLLVAQAHKLRTAGHKLEERQHAQELAAGAIRHERATLADRLREDYSIDLAVLDGSMSAEELQQRDEIEREIAELRRKVQNIGNVNLESLEELDQLETRFATLSSQYDDLAKAKALLEQIIGKINADSRRLFAETLEIVKGHFQALFRKLFGGGHADIVLEEGADILESGIEIIARPPGKEPRNISLLSGGEKTLTCVALLLAIFQYRPSPFCVLDEVDAALDEANIERFITVLQEFLAWTQFIVVTHSKKSMTCATTLYGVTMQESGVSKRVSVRFDDVSDDGKIRADAGEEEAA